MSLKNAQRVIGYAAHHEQFRMALRRSPSSALAEFGADLNLEPGGCSTEEMDAVLSFSEDDYKSFDKLIGKFPSSLSEDDRTSLKIT